MQNEFIEELRRKARQGEEAYKQKVKGECPWISEEALEEMAFENTLEKMFNPKDSRGGEER